MKKRSLIFILAILTFVTAFVSTLALFTDKVTYTKTMTVGNISIELFESNLHRTNNGTTEAGRMSIADPDLQGLANTAPEKAHWDGAYFTDEQILASAETYDDYLANEGTGMVPSQSVMKCPYVLNTGNSPAYVRVRVLVPATLDGPELLFDSGMYVSEPIDKGIVKMSVRTVVREGTVYNEYAFTYQDPLEPGEMTFWNVWGDVKVADDISLAQMRALAASGAVDPTDKSFNVVMEADAIQYRGFTSAAEAFLNFDSLQE